MKKLTAVLLTACLLLCLLPAAGAEEEFRFTRENFPILDGSTSMVPLGEGIASVLLGETREAVGDLISFHRTTQSFRNLAEGTCDLVIAAEPQSIVFDEMRDAGFAWKMEPIAREALVFVVNADNPVDSLTTEQLRGIYSGEITDWSQLGGAQQPIEAFQRNPSSGSQVMMEKLVMAGAAMMPAPEAHIPGAMGELIDAVKSYDNSANAIGYTVYYYASDMRMAEGLKILKVDGVEPCAETIRGEEYPFRNDYYCCMDANAPADSPQGLLYDWLLSEQGQALLASEGYVSAYAPGEAPAFSAVITDDSSYIPYGGDPAVYTRAGESGAGLMASDSYGMIYPYRGSRLYYSWDNDLEDFEAGSMWGFYTHDGLLVTDPVYTSIRTEFIDWNDAEAWCWAFTDDSGTWGFAAKDGSWVSDMRYESVSTIGSVLLCVSSYEENLYELYDCDLKLIATQADFPENCIPSDCRAGLYCCTNYSDWSSCVVRDGRVILSADGYISLCKDGTIVASDENYVQQVYAPDGTQLLFGDESKFDYVYDLSGPFFSVCFLDGSEAICSAGGSVFLSGFDYCSGELEGFRVVRDGISTWYSSEGRILWDNIPERWFHVSGDVFEEYADAGIVLHNVSTGKERHIADAGYISSIEGRMAVTCFAGREYWHTYWLEPDLSLSDADCTELMLYTDYTTGNLAVRKSMYTGLQIMMSLDMTRELGRGVGELGLQGDAVTIADERGFTCLSADGTVLFRYPYYGLRSGD